MRIWPLVIDSQPQYLDRSVRRSLLALPLGNGTVFDRVRAAIATVTPNAPMILAPAGAGADYATQVTASCPGVHVLNSGRDLIERLASYEISDVLLVVDPRCLPVSLDELRALIDHFSGEQQVAHHLVAFEAVVAGTKEQVSLDADGHVRSIHRFYEPVTWPFLAGVAASLVPLSGGLFRDGSLPTSLPELRERVMSHGVSSRDLPIVEGAWNLTTEPGLLAANEHLLTSLPDPALTLVGAGHQIHASARLLGPVALHDSAVVEHDAVIVGPALIGAHARVSAGSMVVHAIVGQHATVPAGTTVRNMLWLSETDAERPELPQLATETFEDRVARMMVDERRNAVRRGRDSSIWLRLRAKRVADMVLAAFGLLMLSPLLALVAALIRLDSKGSPLYGSEREGKDGRPFTCWKFRTMVTNAHALQHQLTEAALDGPHFKMERDPRVTRIGRWLRKTNIDELPQLYNVMTGTMSLVGPRPSPFRENQICVPWRDARLSVRPGMTGLWQVCRQDREAGDFHQWIEYDLLYVRHISLWLDVKILLATILTAGGQVPVPSSWMVRTNAETAPAAGRPTEPARPRAAVAGRISPASAARPADIDKPSAKSA